MCCCSSVFPRSDAFPCFCCLVFSSLLLPRLLLFHDRWNRKTRGRNRAIDLCFRVVPASWSRTPSWIPPLSHAHTLWLLSQQENNFEPLYIQNAKKKPIINRLKKASAKCDEIILATDEDREGEAISWHLLQVKNLGGVGGVVGCRGSRIYHVGLSGG